MVEKGCDRRKEDTFTWNGTQKWDSSHGDPALQLPQLKMFLLDFLLNFLVEFQKEVFKTPLTVTQFKWKLPSQVKSRQAKPCQTHSNIGQIQISWNLEKGVLKTNLAK